MQFQQGDSAVVQLQAIDFAWGLICWKDFLDALAYMHNSVCLKV